MVRADVSTRTAQPNTVVVFTVGLSVAVFVAPIITLMLRGETPALRAAVPPGVGSPRVGDTCVDSARIDSARKLLESTELPLKAVAFDSGFGTTDRMRIVFKERVGVTPAQYRASFQRADPS